MLKKRILILSGKTFRGVIKLSYLETSHLELDLTAHFLPAGDYLLLLKIGDYMEKLSFNGEKLLKRLRFEANFDMPIEAAVIEQNPFAVLLVGSSDKKMSVVFNSLVESYASSGTAAEKSADRKAASDQSAPKNSMSGNITPTPPEVRASAAAEEGNASVSAVGSEPFNSEPQGGAMKKDSPPLAGSPLSSGEKTASSQSSETTVFLESIKESLNEFFDNYPPYEELTRIVPSSKWVRVDTDGAFYVVGLLYNTGGITHICYGIPGEYNIKPESEVPTEWLPLNPEEWEKSGFWMIYQNADTGQI